MVVVTFQDAVLGVDTDRGSAKSRYLPPHLRGKQGQEHEKPPPESYRETSNRDKGALSGALP
jgi:hypothetical protein